MPVTVYTVGHSNHPLEAFLELLAAGGIDAVADVRSVPFSRRFPHFSRPRLEAVLTRRGLGYMWLGAELGARREEPECIRDGAVDYDLVARTPGFAEGLRRVEEAAREGRVALLCAEREPLDCHRTVLVARHLVRRGAEIRHILPGGAIEPHPETERRLLARMGLAGEDLLGGGDLDLAYELRGREMTRPKTTRAPGAGVEARRTSGRGSGR